ncbi:hypothetical protein ABK040_007573 [Willaertia magna]
MAKLRVVLMFVKEELKEVQECLIANNYDKALFHLEKHPYVISNTKNSYFNLAKRTLGFPKGNLPRQSIFLNDGPFVKNNTEWNANVLPQYEIEEEEKIDKLLNFILNSICNELIDEYSKVNNILKVKKVISILFQLNKNTLNNEFDETIKKGLMFIISKTISNIGRNDDNDVDNNDENNIENNENDNNVYEKVYNNENKEDKENNEKNKFYKDLETKEISPNLILELVKKERNNNHLFLQEQINYLLKIIDITNFKYLIFGMILKLLIENKKFNIAYNLLIKEKLILKDKLNFDVVENYNVIDLIKIFGENKKYDLILDVLKNKEKLQNQEDFEITVNYLSKSQNQEHFDFILQLILWSHKNKEKLHFKIKNNIVANLFKRRSLIYKLPLEKIIELYNIIFYDSEIKFGSKFINIFLNIFLKHNRMELAKNIFDKFNENKIIPNTGTITIILTYFLENNLNLEGLYLCEKFLQLSGLMIDTPFLNNIWKTYHIFIFKYLLYDKNIKNNDNFNYYNPYLDINLIEMLKNKKEESITISKIKTLDFYEFYFNLKNFNFMNFKDLINKNNLTDDQKILLIEHYITSMERIFDKYILNYLNYFNNKRNVEHSRSIYRYYDDNKNNKNNNSSFSDNFTNIVNTLQNVRTTFDPNWNSKIDFGLIFYVYSIYPKTTNIKVLLEYINKLLPKLDDPIRNRYYTRLILSLTTFGHFNFVKNLLLGMFANYLSLNKSNKNLNNNNDLNNNLNIFEESVIAFLNGIILSPFKHQFNNDNMIFKKQIKSIYSFLLESVQDWSVIKGKIHCSSTAKYSSNPESFLEELLK